MHTLASDRGAGCLA